MKTLGNAKMISLKDKLNEIEAKKVPADAPVVEEKTAEQKDVKKEMRKIKK